MGRLVEMDKRYENGEIDGKVMAVLCESTGNRAKLNDLDS